MPNIKQSKWTSRVKSDFHRSSEGHASASSRGPQHAQKDQDDRSDPRAGDFLAGNEALGATSDLLFQRLQTDERLQKWLTHADVPQLTSQVQHFLCAVFDGADWPELCVTPSLVDAHFEGLVGALFDAMRRPLPLGEDVLAFAIRSLHTQLRNDVRVQLFFEHIQHAAHRHSDEEPPRSKPDLPLTDVVDAQPAMKATSGSTCKSTPSASAAKLEELILEPYVIQEIQKSWADFRASAQSLEAASDMLYGAFFEGARNLQAFFRTPRVVQAAKFMDGLNGFVLALDDPAKLNALVDFLAFTHPQLDITEIHVVTVTDALLDLFAGELADGFTTVARDGWKKLLQYLGDALMSKKKQYADHVKILQRSWHHVRDNGTKADDRGA